MIRRTFGAVLPAVVLLVPALLSCRVTSHLIRAAANDTDMRQPLPPGYVDDAGRLDKTHVREVINVPADEAAARETIRTAVTRARAQGLHVSIAGARHSMGGQALYPEGLILNMISHSSMRMDEDHAILHVQSGARWSAIIPYLDERGWSVAVMQSNNPFTVGGSVSVNAHGWQANHAPIASTVDALTVMRADGTIVHCNRTENGELFSLVLGGYGLFGVILDVDLRIVRNELYRLQSLVIPTTRYVDKYKTLVRQSNDAAMAFGRLSIEPEPTRFLREAILNVFRRVPLEDGRVPRLHDAPNQNLARWIFRGSVGSDYGKKVRWEAEKRYKPPVHSISRNQVLNEGIEVFENRTEKNTDILHEYFIPPDHVEAFLERCRRIIPAHHGDLLNVTVREIEEDKDSFLRYATRDMFSFVMLFNYERTHEADAAMESMTRELVDAAVAEEGRYYLPYRLHATRKQLEAAYPQARRFFEMKRRYDPEEIFQNQFYAKYGQP